MPNPPEPSRAPEPVAPQHGRRRTGAGTRLGAPPWPPSKRGFGGARATPAGGARARRHFFPPGGRSYLRPDVSFFDEDDEPRSRAPRPRRASGGDVSADTQTIRVRQAAAAIGLIVVLLLLVFVVKGCRSSAKENALKDYNREVSTIARRVEHARSGAEFFKLLSDGGSESPQDLQTRDLQLPGAGRAAAHAGQEPRRPRRHARRAPVAADRARVAPRRPGLHRPADPHRARRRGRGGRRGDQADRGPDAGLPLLRRRLRDARACRSSRRRSTTPRSAARTSRRRRSCPNIDWLQPDVVASQLGQTAVGGRGPRQERADGPRPARHGARLGHLRRHRRCSPAPPTSSPTRPTRRSRSSSPTAARTTSSTSR